MDRLTKGGTCIVYDGFRAETFWEVVRRFEITGCCLLSAMVPFLLKQPASPRDRDHPLRAVITVPWNQDSLARRRALRLADAHCIQYDRDCDTHHLNSESERARQLRADAPRRRGPGGGRE